MSDEKKLTPRGEDFSAWYNEVVQRAELADYSPVRGCMVIRPWGYGIWELMQRALDDMFKATGHENAYFPLLIPMSFIEREKEHVEGFAPELAVVTQAGGKELEEPLVIRPTSETIIYSMYAKWVQSYRDLPVLMNQWANVMRWEMRTRLFLRTSEFLWQEGHTAHATPEEAEEETLRILGIYRTFMEDWMGMPPITGLKSDSEKFAGAVRSYACEALMQDNKALQAGTSHFLGQNFARQFDLKFQSEAGQEEYAWNTSWGVSTRLVGGLVMTHGDDNGIVRASPAGAGPGGDRAHPARRRHPGRGPGQGRRGRGPVEGAGVRVKVDARDHLSPGSKYYEWERKGVPFRVEIGPKDLEQGQLALARRVTPEGAKRKEFVAEAEAIAGMPERLDAFQLELKEAAVRRREEHTPSRREDAGRRSREILDGPGGFVYTGWSGDPAVEQR